MAGFQGDVSAAPPKGGVLVKARMAGADTAGSSEGVFRGGGGDRKAASAGRELGRGARLRGGGDMQGIDDGERKLGPYEFVFPGIRTKREQEEADKIGKMSFSQLAAKLSAIAGHRPVYLASPTKSS